MSISKSVLRCEIIACCCMLLAARPDPETVHFQIDIPFESCFRSLVAERYKGLLLEQVLPDVGDVLTIVGAVVTASRTDVRAMSLRTKRDHALVHLQQSG